MAKKKTDLRSLGKSYHIAESTNLISDRRSKVPSGNGLGCGHNTVTFFSSTFTAVTTINPENNKGSNIFCLFYP